MVVCQIDSKIINAPSQNSIGAIDNSSNIESSRLSVVFNDTQYDDKLRMEITTFWDLATVR